ncbi:nitrogen fixation protein FixH [Rhodobacteraceae bacterium RKSG542]|uniref:FixH family protein n=1 Tax=Pseudovibrio flavus TaxID=2529854 RepID=UPI0012BD1EC1|nr:FixH family protein [Pseudovibrio flavus]MTI18839.1 nitrogen fixation protein FixH [Pseudovibrio flavus]
MAYSVNSSDQKSRFTIKGWHVLVAFIAFFGIIASVNGFMVFKAIGTFPGTEVSSSYKVSQRYNQEIARAKAQEALGWAVEANVERSSDGVVQVLLQASDKEGAPITGERFMVTFKRPTLTSADVTLPLSEKSSGVFVGNISDIAAGNWDIVVEGYLLNDPQTPIFRSKNRTFFTE